MRTLAWWARWMLAASVSLAPSLVACTAPPVAVPAPTGATMTVVPLLSDDYHTQTVFAPYTRASIVHVVLRLYVLTGAAPNQIETPVTTGTGDPVQLDVPAASLGTPVSFSNLKPDTRYRVRAFAYNGPGVTEAERISVSDSQSSVDVTVGTDDAPIMVQLRVRLRDRNVYAGPAGANLGLPDGASALPTDAWFPASAFNSVQSEYFVVWRDDRFGHKSLVGRRLSATGAAQGADIRLTAGLAEADAPAVAFDPTAQEYLVVWQEARGAGTVVVGRRVGADGTLRGAEVLLTSGSATTQYQPKVAFNSTSGEYLVVWNEFRAATGLDVVGRRVAGGGTPVGSDLTIAANANSQEQPAIAYNPTLNEFLVAWSEGRGGTTGYDIMGRRVAAAGALVGSELTLSAAATAQHQPSVAYHAGAAQYLVAWSELRGTWDVVGRRLAGDGGGAEADLTIASNTNPQFQPVVGANPAGTDYLVVFNEHRGASGWDVLSKRVPTTGAVPAGQLVLAGSAFQQFQPTVVHRPTGGQALVAWHTATTSGGDLYTSVVGTSASTPAALGNANRSYVDQRSARIVADAAGTGHLLAWLDVDQGAPAIRGQLVTNRGARTGDPFVVSVSSNAKAFLAAGYNPIAREYLLVWQEYRGDAGWDILARRVNTNGLMLLGSEIVVASSNYAQEQPAVAFSPDTQEYLIVWQETLGNQVANVVGKRLSANGALLGGEFVLAPGANPQEQPVVAYHAGAQEFLAAWSEKRAGNAWDVFARRIGTSGPVGSAFAIATGANYQEQPAIAYNPSHQEVLITWQEHRGATGYDVLGRRVSAAGALLGSALVVASDPAAQEQPVVSFNPTAGEYLVAWHEQRAATGWDVLAQRLTPTGAAIGQNLVVAEAALDQLEPRVAYHPGSNDWLLCWRDGRQSPTGSNFDVYMQAIDSFASP